MKKEIIWLTVTFFGCSFAALVLIWNIPFVSELPEGMSTPLEYVVNATVARFGLPVVIFLFFAAALTVLGHNEGDVRYGCDFAAKVCSFGAAIFSLWAVGVALQFAA